MEAASRLQEERGEDVKKLTFEDMGPEFMTFPVTGPDNEQYELRIKTMTEGEVNAVNAGVDEPQPPIKERFISKEKGYVKEKDETDPEYIKRRSEAGRLRMYRLMAAAVDLGIPGDTIEAKAKALQEKGVPAWILTASVGLINQSLGLDAGEIQRRVEAFQSD